MLYRVYAQCCRNPQPIKEVYDIDSYIDECTNRVAEQLDTSWLDEDDDKGYCAYYEVVWHLLSTELEENKYLDCGDYCIIIADERPDSRPNVCGYPDVDLVDVWRLMNRMVSEGDCYDDPDGRWEIRHIDLKNDVVEIKCIQTSNPNNGVVNHAPLAEAIYFSHYELH